MDMSAIIVVGILSGAFFGFVLWAAFQSRKSNSEKVSDKNTEFEFAEIGKRNNDQVLKR